MQYTRNGKVEYEGDFKGNMREGYGVFQWPDKSSYKGQWVGDEPCGEDAKYTDKKNEVTIGKKAVKKAKKML